jgi:hypothetical protein
MSLLGYINNGLNQSLNGIVTITDGNGTTISDGVVSSNSMAVSNFTATNLSSNNLTITGTITLPNGSILDAYLTSNVPLKNIPNTFTGYVDFNAGVGVNSGNYITFADSTNTIFSQIGQYNNNLSITNYGTGSIIVVSPDVDLTNTYTTLKGGTNVSNYFTHLPYTDGINYISGETHFRLGLVYLDYGSITFNSSGLSLCSIYQASTAFMINNTNVSGTIQFRALNSSGISSIPLTINTSTLILNTDVNIVQSGSTSINTLKASIFNGNITVRGSNSILLYNTANTISTQIFQNGATLKFSNPSTPSQYLFEAYDGFGSLYTYTIGSTFTSGGDIVCNMTSLTLKDGTNSTTNMTQSSGNCNIQNTKSSGSIKLTTQDATTNTRDLVISYNSVSIPSLLTCNNGFTLSSGSLTLPNNSISDSALSTNIPKLNASNTYTNTNTFQNLLTCSNGFTLSSGSLTLPNNSVSDSALSTNIPKLNTSNTFSNTNTYNVGISVINSNITQSLTGIISQSGTGNNSLKSTTFTGELTLQSNTNLPTTFTTQTTGQLGYIQTGVNYGLAVNPLTSGTTYGKGQLDNLPIGIWIIEGQATFQALGSFNYTYELCIITGTGSTFTYDNYKTGYFQANATNDIFGDKVSKVVINSAITSYKMLFRIIRQTGNALFSPIVGNTFLQAVRIA